MTIDTDKWDSRNLVVRMHARTWELAFKAAQRIQDKPPPGYRLLGTTIRRDAIAGATQHATPKAQTYH